MNRLVLTLSLILLLVRITRTSAQEENFAGHRREFYREDNHRINVDTDSYRFDVGLGPNIRLNGDVVFDAISGATPTGAPPQSKWPFPKYNDFYQNAFKPLYEAAFNQFVADNQIYVDAGYETYQTMTNQAAQFAAGAAGPLATTNALASYHSLTNDPHFRKTTVPLTQMHDFRSALDFALPVTILDNTFTPSVAYSHESDYVSHVAALNYSLALNKKNTILSAGYSHNGDRVRNDLKRWEDKNTDDVLVGLVQLISPKSYLTLDFTFGSEAGYLSDPYRGVMFDSTSFEDTQTNPRDAALNPEKRPRHRTRQVAYAAWTQFVEPANASINVDYRFFHDSFDTFAHTVSTAWNQKLGSRVIISPNVRYYWQSAAYFYYSSLVPAGADKPEFYSSDYRLSSFQSLAGGVRITVRCCKYFSIDGSYMRYAMEGVDGKTSQSAYPSANVFSIGGRIWF